jgi:hypothetical protein
MAWAAWTRSTGGSGKRPANRRGRPATPVLARSAQARVAERTVQCEVPDRGPERTWCTALVLASARPRSGHCGARSCDSPQRGCLTAPRLGQRGFLFRTVVALQRTCCLGQNSAHKDAWPRLGQDSCCRERTRLSTPLLRMSTLGRVLARTAPLGTLGRLSTPRFPMTGHSPQGSRLTANHA